MPNNVGGKDLSRADFLKMLKVGTVDTGSGTLFGVPQTRAVERSRLTLVISTGGSGKAAIQKALNIANQKLDKDYSTYMKFLVIDSAKDELEPLKRQGIDVLNISSPMAQIRLKNENRSSFYQKFIDKDFPVHLINSDGASQVRQIGKVKLYDQNDGTTNDQLLQNKIAGYFAGDWAEHQDNPVDIMILTGISGGNGSGTFIDIAVRAKKACPSPANVTVYGYIMLPDTAEQFAANDEAKRSLYRNGFAALKELESYESIAMETARRETMPSNNEANTVELSSTNIPYNYPILMSGNYDEAVGIIAETIVNAAADNGGAFGQASFYSNKDAQRSNKLASAVVSRHGILKPNACPEDSHMYCSIGYAHASIPEKIVIPHVIGTVSKRLYEPAADMSIGAAANVAATSFCTKEKSLSKQDYQKAMRDLLGLTQNQELKESSLWTKLNMSMGSLCRLKDNTVDISYDDVVSGNIGQYMKGFGTTGAINKATDEMKKVIEKEYETIKTKAQGIMKNYGPRAMQYLYDGTGNPDEHGVNEDYSEFCLKTQIEFVKNRFMDQKAGVMPRRLEPLTIWGKVVEHLAKTRMDEWKDATRRCEEVNVRYGVSQMMKGANGIWQTSFVTPMNDFLWSTSRFADVLETISDYYEGIGKSLRTDDFRDFANQSGEANGINLCRDAGMYTWVKGKISSKLANVQIQNVRDDLIDDFYKNTLLWTSNEDGVARKQFDEVMSKVCAVGKYAGANNGMDLTITDYFNHVISTVPNARQQVEISNAVNLIFSQLMTKSKPCLKVKQGTVQVCNGTIMLPQALQAGASGPMIQQAFQNQLAGMNAAQSNLVFSSVVDSIVCYQTSVADALSDIDDIELWENAYDQLLDTTTHLHNGEHPTLHMDTGYSQYNELTMEGTTKAEHLTAKREVYPAMAKDPSAKQRLDTIYGTGLSWPHYPSINVTRYGNTFNGNDGTQESLYRRDVFSKKIEEALRLRVIECERTGDVYKYFINLIPREWTNFGVRAYKNKHKTGEDQGLYIRGRELFDFLADQNRESTSIHRKQIYLQNTPFFGPAGFDFSMIKQVENWSQERIDREHKAYLMRMMRKSTGLYQDMEDTLFKLYPVEYYLEEKEIIVKIRASYRKFFEMYLAGLVNSDEKGLEWTAIVDEDGGKEKLTKFSKIMLRNLNDGIDKKLIMDKLRLYYVYKQYAEIREEFKLSDEKLDKIQSKINRRVSEEAQEELLDERTALLKAELNQYKEKYCEEDDPLEAIMDAYKIEEYQMDEIQPVVDFYDTLDEVLQEQEDLF